jgi:hypothetical protein
MIQYPINIVNTRFCEIKILEVNKIFNHNVILEGNCIIIAFYLIIGPKSGIVEIDNNDHGKGINGYDPGVIAAIRETNEEFGINVKLQDIIYQYNFGHFCNVFAFIQNFDSSMVKGPSNKYVSV